MVKWKKLVKRIPPRVQINRNSFYEVCWIEDFPDGNTLGETRYDPKQIVIKKGLSPKLTVQTYLHEIGHAVSEEFKANLTETQVLAIEAFFYYMLKNDNIFAEKK